MAKTSLREISLDTLPLEVKKCDAFAAEFVNEISEICMNLRNGRNVLVKVERRDAEFVMSLVQSTMRSGTLRFDPLIADGAPGNSPMPTTGISRMLEQVGEFKSVSNAALNGKKNPFRYIVIPHLDTMTSLGNASLTDLGRNLIVHLADTSIPVLGIVEPSLVIPSTIEAYFPNKFTLKGLRRETLPSITTKKFALTLSGDCFDALGLHTYVGGMSISDFVELQDRILNEGQPELMPGSENKKSIYKLIHKYNQTSKFTNPEIKFSDIAGYEEVKNKLIEEVFMIQKMADDAKDEKEQDELSKLVPHGIIFEGPPGTGKTLFAKAIATMYGANITVVAASSLMNMYVGESERGIREVFESARKQTPSVIVFDEIDAFASQRGSDTGGGGVKHSMVNTLLSEMDGFASNKGIIVVATTNFIEAIDGALLRPGRFDLKITIPQPSSEDRSAILKLYRRKFGLKNEVSDEIIQHAVECTEGLADYRKGLPYTGDHLANLMKGLSRIIMRKQSDGITNYQITLKDVEITLNPSYSKKITLTDHEKIVVGIHECGHAIIALLYPNAGKIKEITIAQNIPGALGYVQRTKPENDKSMTRNHFRMIIRILFGGKAAEEVIFGQGNHSTGVAQDLRNANLIATEMHYSYGMSNSGLVIGENPSHSIKTSMDNEINALLKEEYEATKKLILMNKSLLQKMSKDLLREESIRDVSKYIPIHPDKNDENLHLETRNILSLEDAFDL